MTTIDIVFLVLIALGAISGFVNGLIKQLATIFGLIAGLFVAKALYLSVAEKLSPVLGDSMTAAQIIAFVAIWVLVPLVCSLIAALLTRFLNAIALGWINKLLGFAAGICITLIVISVLLNVLDFVDSAGNLISETIKDKSLLYYPVKDLVGRVIPALKDVTQPYILI